MKHILTITMLILLLTTSTLFAKDAGKEWDALCQEAVELFQAGDNDSAILVARKALELAEKNVGHDHPDASLNLNNLGMACDKTGMYKEAIEALKHAIRIKPDYSDAHNNLGNAYAGTGMHKEAIEAYKQAIGIEPDDANAHSNLGITYSAVLGSDQAKW